MTADLRIRDAVQADVPCLYALLRDKAAFDGYPGSLLATEDSLRSALFGTRPATRALVAAVGGRPVGFATYHAIFSTFLMQPGLWLDDLYIDAAQRGKGIGRAMMAQLAAIGKEEGCARVDWTVDVENEGGQRFYADIGADIKQGLRLCRLDRAAIDALACGHVRKAV